MGNYHAGFGEGVTVLLEIGITYSTLFWLIPEEQESRCIILPKTFTRTLDYEWS